MNKTAIITAMQEEADYIINHYGLKLVKKLQNISFFENDKIVLVLAGIGKIQASIATTCLFENYKIDKLINIGIAGNLRGQEFSIGDVFIVNNILQHDMYLPFDGEHLSYAKEKIIIKNNIRLENDFDFVICNDSYCLTGDQFIDNKEKVSELFNKYGAHVIEMEAYAIASVAKEYGRINDCIFIKAISDGADNNAINEHMSNLDFAMKNSLEVLKQII